MIEDSTREVISDAIDNHDPFSGNATKLIERWSAKQVLQALVAVSQGRITIGDLAANSVTIGSYGELIETLEKIFGQGVEDDLRATTELWLEDIDRPADQIISDFKATRSIITNLFRIRHILVHEAPGRRSFELSEVGQLIAHTRQLIAAIHWYGIKRTQRPQPLTQLMMTLSAHDDADKAEAALSAIRSMSKEEAVQGATRRHRVEAAWDKFAHLAAELAAADSEDSSSHTMAQSEAHASLNWWRVERLRKEALRIGRGQASDDASTSLGVTHF